MTDVAVSGRRRRAALAGAVLVAAAAGAASLPRGSWAAVSTAAAGPAAADKAAQSDIRGAISAVEEYYSVLGHYPTVAIHSGGGMRQLDLGGSTPKIQLAAGTRLYYAPAPRAAGYRICATNTRGTGKWYLYASACGGSVKAVRPPAKPAACA